MCNDVEPRVGYIANLNFDDLIVAKHARSLRQQFFSFTSLGTLHDKRILRCPFQKHLSGQYNYVSLLSSDVPSELRRVEHCAVKLLSVILAFTKPFGKLNIQVVCFHVKFC